LQQTRLRGEANSAKVRVISFRAARLEDPVEFSQYIIRVRKIVKRIIQ
jgi:hypothetical protein